MTIKDERIIEYQELYKKCFGIDIAFDQAKMEALHLIRILRVLRRKHA